MVKWFFRSFDMLKIWISLIWGMKECHSFSCNYSQKFVTINVVRGSNNASEACAAAVHFDRTSGQFTPCNRAHSAIDWKHAFASEQKGEGNSAMQVEQFFKIIILIFFYFYRFWNARSLHFLKHGLQRLSGAFNFIHVRSWTENKETIHLGKNLTCFKLSYLVPLFVLVRLYQRVADTEMSLHWNVMWWMEHCMVSQEAFLQALPLTRHMIFCRT